MQMDMNSYRHFLVILSIVSFHSQSTPQEIHKKRIKQKQLLSHNRTQWILAAFARNLGEHLNPQRMSFFQNQVRGNESTEMDRAISEMDRFHQNESRSTSCWVHLYIGPVSWISGNKGTPATRG